MTDAPAPNNGALAPFFKTQVKNLGVLFDNRLNFEKQIRSVRGKFIPALPLGQSEAFS